MIPLHKFDLVPLTELSQYDEFLSLDEIPLYSTGIAIKLFIHKMISCLVLLTYLLTNVIGVIEELEAIHTINTKYAPTPVVWFRISDGE